MAHEKKIAFLVEADIPALLFCSKAAAEAYLEAVDVLNGVYPIAFDRHGAVFDVVPDGSNARLVPDISGRVDGERLGRVLRRFLVSVGVTVDEDVPLEDIFKIADRFCE
jgi:hypothetical protein